MGRFTAGLVPFKIDGEYGDEIDITKEIDFSSISNISQQVDNSEYLVGVLTYNEFTLKLINDHGKFSTPENAKSIFGVKRKNSLFRLYWQRETYPPVCGLAIAGISSFSPKIRIYEGLINDSATKEDVKTQKVTFKVLSLESIVDQVEVVNGTISNGDTLKEALIAILDQELITDLFELNSENWILPVNETLDNAQALSNKKGKEGLDELLLMSNSVFYIKDRKINIVPRDASAESKMTFYGPASNEGISNIKNISAIRTGENQAYNYWTWDGDVLKVTNASSIADIGVRKKKIKSEVITENSKRTTILAALASEHGDKKQGLKLTVPLDYKNIELFFFDKINIDYPTVYKAGEGKEIPVYDISKYGEASYPIKKHALTIDKTKDWKIKGIEINPKNNLIEFNLKAV